MIYLSSRKTVFLMRVSLLLLLFQILNIFSLYSNEGLQIIKNFKPDDYEGGSRVYSVICTEEGLLYAGDKSGINEFDGEKWNKIECGFSVTSLALDSNNVVYIAGSKGFGKLIIDSTNTVVYKSLTHYITTEKSIRKYRYSKVFNIKNKIIFVLGNEIVINTPESVRIIESPHNFTYYQKLNNELYFYSNEDGVFQLSGNKLIHINNKEELKNKKVQGFFKYKKQLHVLISGEGAYNLETNLMSAFESLMSEVILKKVIGIDQIDDSSYALKTYYDGVFLFDSNGELLKKYHYEEGLTNNTVFSVFKDYWNNLWVGTASGISAIRLDFPFTRYNNQHGIGTGYGSVLYKNKIYLATSQGLYISEKNNKDHLVYTKLFDEHVWGLHKIDEALYFGSASGIYSWNNQEIKRVSFYPGAWYILNIPNNPNYYITGTPLGLILLQKEDNGLLKHVRLLEGIHTNIKNIEVDKENNYWAEFNNGLYKFNLNEDLTAVINVVSFDRIEPNNKLKRVKRYQERLFFVADSGIYAYNQKGFYKDSSFMALLETKIYPSNIIIDRYNRMWMFSNGKISCYKTVDDKLKKLFLLYTEFADGTYPSDYENIFAVDSNLVIIGQEEGFLGYNLAQKSSGIYSSNRIRKVVFTSRKGREQNLIANTEILNGTQTSNLGSGIKYGNSIKFYFSAGCSKYNSVKYATFLHGFDKKWSDWSNQAIKEYTNLPKGDYKFIVRSINKSFEESNPAIYNFRVLPPWYLTPVAKIGYGIGLILLIFMVERIIQIRSKRLKHKLGKKQEEILYRKEQVQIQENLKKQQEIIKLRNEKLRIDNLYKSKELANSTMGIIKKNQFLTDLKLELEKIKEYSEKNKLVTSDVKDVIRKIDRDIDNEENWKVFEDYFDRVHEKFLNRMKTKYPILTSKDLRLSAYLRMNLSTKEIAPLMNITIRGAEISRYRLRKKLGLDRNDNLNDFLLKF